MEKNIGLSIVTTSEGRALDYDGEQFPLPALPFNATVHAYQTPAGLWAGVQAPGEPRPVYAGSGGVDLGSVELEADPTAVTEQQAGETRTRMAAVIQHHLDSTAQQRNYDGIVSLCTYATSTRARFASEGQAGVEWRDAVWAMGYQLLDEALTGARGIPTEEELIEMLPEMVWPG